MAARYLGLAACAFIAGCSLDAEGIGGTSIDLVDASDDTSSVADTTVVIEDTGTPPGDDAAVDTIVPDTGGVDTTLPPVDSGPPDMGPPDMGPPDTGPPDTGPPDMGPPDMGPPETPVTGTLSVTARSLSGSLNFNLTTEGTRDWAHWGFTMTDSFHSKMGGSAITKGTKLGAASFESVAYQFTWSDSATAPTAVADTRRGLTLSMTGEHVTFEVQGNPSTELTLDVWVSGTGKGSVTGTLTGSTAGPSTVNLDAGVDIVTFKFRTASMTSKLRVEAKKPDNTGSFNLFAAALK